MVAITVLFSCLRVFEYVFRYSRTSFEGPRLHNCDLIKTIFYFTKELSKGIKKYARNASYKINPLVFSV